MEHSDGLLRFGRLSIAFNFRPSCAVRAFGLGLVVFPARLLWLVGPFTLFWRRQSFDELDDVLDEQPGAGGKL